MKEVMTTSDVVIGALAASGVIVLILVFVWVVKMVFIDNDKIINQSTKDILSKNCKSLQLSLEEEDFHYLNKDQFKTNYSHSYLLDLNKFFIMNLKYVLKIVIIRGILKSIFVL